MKDCGYLLKVDQPVSDFHWYFEVLANTVAKPNATEPKPESAIPKPNK